MFNELLKEKDDNEELTEEQKESIQLEIYLNQRFKL